MSTKAFGPYTKTRMMLESAILIGISLVLNEVVKFSSTWVYGGSITLGSMIPVAMIAWRWGTRQGLFSAFVFSLLQMFLGFKNVLYGSSFFQMAAIAFLDYILAYTVLGLAAVPRNLIKDRQLALGAGVVLVMALRFLCHFLSGWLIWNALWPNAEGYSGPIYSLLYNGSYMLPETLLALPIAVLLYVPLERFWNREDISISR